MIADLDETLRQLLIAELPIKNGEIDVKFDQPKREWSAKLTKPTANLFLYDLRENATLRRHQWEQMANGNGGNGRGDGNDKKQATTQPNLARMKRSPFRVDCFYMLTAWAAEPEDEHRLLTRTMLALFRYPILTKDRLVGQMVHQPYDVSAALARHDRLTNPAEVWSALDNEMRPTVSYIVTLALDPWSEVSGPIVRSLTLRAGQTKTLPYRRQLDPEGVDVDMTTIGGTVWDKSAPQPGVQVAVKGTGLFATSDAQGRFALGSLPPGQYTLVAWPA
ncbi:MAG: Pvc16 family protein, partial [Chloroflexi bacterium]|nr:Pvc16 family protein [Chloroflexota bacterium]